MSRPKQPCTKDVIRQKTAIANNSCWEWQGYRKPNGYGFYAGQYTHRLAYKLFIGDIGDMNVCHTCDNPSCCNPEHLFLGTQSDNANDMVAKKRSYVAFEKIKSHCKRGHPLSGDNLYVHKTGRRQCLTCQRMTSKLRDRRLRHTPEFKANASTRSRKHYNKIKDDPEFKMKNAARARAWWAKNRGKNANQNI